MCHNITDKVEINQNRDSFQLAISGQKGKIFQNNDYCIFYMYRVLLKIDKVSIRIKEAIHIHIIVKKKQEYFTHCKHQILMNGQLILNYTSEFFISTKDPSFEIEIYLLSGNLRKKGGNVEINLTNYTLNASHRVIEIIQNTPLHNSTILIDLAYMTTEPLISNRNLISLNQLQEIQHQKYLNQLSQEGKQLIKHNQKLSLEIENLKEKNQSLVIQSKIIEQEYTKRQNIFRAEMQKMEEQKTQNFNTLINQKKKVAEIVDVINQTGDAVLINQMGDTINKKQSIQ